MRFIQTKHIYNDALGNSQVVVTNTDWIDIATWY